MSAFDMSTEGKDATGWLGEYPQWGKGNMVANLQQSQDFKNAGDTVGNYAQSLLNWQLQNYPTLDQTKAAGQTILPGVDAAIADQKANLDQNMVNYSTVTPSWQTATNINNNLQQLEDANNHTTADQNQLVDDAYKSQTGRETAADQSISGDIAKTYGDLASSSGSTYDALAKAGAGAYDTAQSNLELLKPGGEAAAAQAARAYAPAEASSLARMQRSGIDPNSPEAASALRQVDVAKGRAMDDQLEATTASYVNSKNALTLGAQAQQQDLALGKQNSAQQLAEQKLGASTQEQTRTLLAQNGMDAQKAATKLGISNTSYTRTADWLSQSNNLQTLYRAMQQQDWSTVSGMLKDFNNEDLTALNLQMQQYQLGAQAQTSQLTEQDKQTAALLGLSQQDYANMMAEQGMALNWGNSSINPANITATNAAANADWAGKALVGVGGSLLSAGLTGGLAGSGVQSTYPGMPGTAGGTVPPIDYSQMIWS